MSKYKEMYKKNGLKLGHPEEKFKEYLDSRRVRRSVLVDEQRDDAIFGCNEPVPTRYEPKSYKNMKTEEGLNENEKRTVTKSKVRPFVVGVVRHKIHSPPFLHGPYKQEPCAHSSKKNTTPLKSFAPRNYKFNPPKGLHIYTYTPAGSAGPASPITFDSIFRNRNQNNVKRRKIDFGNITMRSRNVKKSPKNSPLRTITNTLAVQKDESEGVCIFGRLNLARELNRSVSRMSSDSTCSSDERSTKYTSTPFFDGQEISLLNSTSKVEPKGSAQDENACPDSCDKLTTTMKCMPFIEGIAKLPEGHNHSQRSLKDSSLHEVSSDAMSGIPTLSQTILPEEQNIDEESSHFENIDLTNSILNIENPSIDFTSPTLFNRTYSLKSSSETVQSDEENNSIPQPEETTLQEINGIEQRPPILSEVADNLFNNINVRKRHNRDDFTTIQKKDMSTNHVEVETENSYSESVENSSTEITAIFIGNLPVQMKSRTGVDSVQDDEIDDVTNFSVHQSFINQKGERGLTNSSHAAMQRNSSSNISIPHYLLEMSKSSSNETKACVDTLRSLESKEDKKLDQTVNDDYSDNSVKNRNSQYLSNNQIDIAAFSRPEQDLCEEDSKEVNMSFDESEVTAQTSINDFNTLSTGAILSNGSEDLCNNSFVNNSNDLQFQFHQESRTFVHENVSNFDSLNCIKKNKDENARVDTNIPLHSFGLSDSYFNTSKPQVEGPLFDTEANEKTLHSFGLSDSYFNNSKPHVEEPLFEAEANEKTVHSFGLSDSYFNNSKPHVEEPLFEAEANEETVHSFGLSDSYFNNSKPQVEEPLFETEANEKTVHSFGLSDSYFNISKPQVEGPLFDTEANEKTEKVKSNDYSNILPKNQMNTTVQSIQEISAVESAKNKSLSEDPETETTLPKKLKTMENDIIMDSSICLPLIFEQESRMEKTSLSIVNDMACSVVNQIVNKDLNISIPLNFFEVNKEKTFVNEQALDLETIEKIPVIETNNSCNAGNNDEPNTANEMEYENIISVSDKSEDESLKTQQLTPVPPCDEMPRGEASSNNSVIGNLLNEGIEKSNIGDSPVLSSISLAPCQLQLASFDRNERTRVSKIPEDHNKPQITIDLQENQTNKKIVESLPDSTLTTDPHNSETKCQEINFLSDEEMQKKEIISLKNVIAENMMSSSEPSLVQMSGLVIQDIKNKSTRSADNKLLENTEVLASSKQNTNESSLIEMPSPVVRKSKQTTNKNAKKKLFANDEIIMNQPQNLSGSLLMIESRSMLTRSAKKKLLNNNEAVVNPTRNKNEPISIEVSSPAVQEIKTVSTRSAKNKLFENTEVIGTQSQNLSDPSSMKLSSPAIQGIGTMLTRSAKKKLFANTEAGTSPMQNTNELLPIELSSPVVQGIEKKSTRSSRKKLVASEIVANSTTPRPKQKIPKFQLIVDTPEKLEDSSEKTLKIKEVQSLAKRVLNEISPNIVMNSVNSRGECNSPIVLPKQQKKLNENFSNPAENEVVDLISDDEEDYKSYLSRVLATHVPSVTLSPGSSKVPNKKTPALQVALSTGSPKTPNKRFQKKQNGSPALSPLLKSDTKGNSLEEIGRTPIRLLQLRSRNISVSPSPKRITPMKKAKGVRKNMD